MINLGPVLGTDSRKNGLVQFLGRDLVTKKDLVLDLELDLGGQSGCKLDRRLNRFSYWILFGYKSIHSFLFCLQYQRNSSIDELDAVTNDMNGTD